MDIQDIEYSLAKRVPAMAGGFYIDTVYGEIGIDRKAAPIVMAAVRSALQRQLSAPTEENDLDETEASAVPAALLIGIVQRQIHGALAHARGAFELCNAGQLDWLSAFNRIGGAEDAVRVGCAVIGQALAYATPPVPEVVAQVEQLEIESRAKFGELISRLHETGRAMVTS